MWFSKLLHRNKVSSKAVDRPKTKILFVEDEKALLDVYTTRFEAEGYMVIKATDGEEGLRLAVIDRPDLIVTGILMPKISGFDMIDILKSTPELKHIPVIVLSALSSQEDIDRGMKLGAAEYLIKNQVTLGKVAKVIKRNLKK